MFDEALWAGAHATRNFVLNDPVLDWLNLYGEQKGFIRDTGLPGYDPRTDMSAFLFKKGIEFEQAVIGHLKTRAAVVTIAVEPGQIRDPQMAEQTVDAMARGAPIIYKGVLHDDRHQTYGSPDLMVRSNILHELFPAALSAGDAAVSAPAVKGGSFHYRIVDIKFTTLDLLVSGELGNSDSGPAYKAQLFIYNRALAQIQGYLPPVSYLLGPAWKQTIKGETRRGVNAMELLAPVSQTGMVSREKTIAAVVDAACDWVRRVRSDGMNWTVCPHPSVPELRPNMGNKEDAPWAEAKKAIVDELDALTVLWQVGAGKRDAACRQGIRSWRDKRCTAEAVGITGAKQQPILQAILDINQREDGPTLSPDRVTACREIWGPDPPLEFFVDFETVTDLNDDFSDFPRRGGQPMIFMIGCGHMENDAWTFKCFTATSLTPSAEAVIIDDWIDHMGQIRLKTGNGIERPVVYHWSHAETTNLSTAYNASVQRHPDKAGKWSSPHWFDFLKEVMRAEPVVVRGALGFGLKMIARAMHRHGLIQTLWGEGSMDGLGAMVGAWWCCEEAAKNGLRSCDISLMKEIEHYNEIDCRVMMEIVHHLRKNH